MSGKISLFLFYKKINSLIVLAKRGIDSKDYFILTIQIPVLHHINSIISTNIVNFKCALSYNTSLM